MKLKQNLLALFSALVLLSGCAGSQWEKQMVSGSAGPVYEIRASRPSSSPQAAAQQTIPQVDPQARQSQLQEQLLKMSAMLPRQDFKDYKVGPEDLLQVNFLEVSDKLNSTVRVNGQGRIRLLLVGDVDVNGLSTVEVAKKLTRLYKEGDYLKNPQIMVAVMEYRYQKVAVTGAVNKPDSYALIGPRTLLEVLGMANGLSDRAGEAAHIMRPRNGSQPEMPASAQVASLPGADTVVVDLNKLLLQGATELNVSIQNGDIVFIPFAHSAFVLGSVARPGGVVLRDNVTVTKAVSQCQGQDIKLSSNTVTVLRVDDKGQRQTIPVDLAQVLKGKQQDIALLPNDIVYVHESPIRRFMFDVKMFMPGNAVSPATFY